MRVQSGNGSILEIVNQVESQVENVGHTDRVQTVTIEQLFSSEFNPRQQFERIEELALSIYSQTQRGSGGEIRRSGVIIPMIVRSVGKRYEVISGERRYRALQKLRDGFYFDIDSGVSKKWIEVPEDYPIPIVIENLTDSEAVELMLVENSNRQDLSFLEKSDVLMQWCEAGLSERQMALKFGSCINTVRSYLLIGRKLCLRARYMLEEGEINMAQAKILASVDSPLYDRLLGSGMSASQMRLVVSVAAFTTKNAIFDIKESGLKLEDQFLDCSLPKKFEDQHAAMAAQIEALNCRAEKIRKENPSSWCEVICVDDDPNVLPIEYQNYGATKAGVVLTCNSLTGEVGEFDQVYRVKSEKKCKNSTAVKKHLSKDSSAISRADRDLEKAEFEARHHANIDEMMVTPKVALAHVVITIFDNAKVDRSASANRELVSMLAEIHPNLFATLNGVLQRATSKADLFTSLRNWSIPALAELLVYLTSGQVKDVMYAKAVTLALSECKSGQQ